MPRGVLLIALTIVVATAPHIASAALSMPHSWTTVSDDGQYLLVMVSPLTVKEDADYYDNWPGKAHKAEEIRALRAKYTQSGMYRNDSSTTPLWTTWYYLPPSEVFISPDAQHVAFVSDWVKFFGSADRGGNAVRFLQNGQEIASQDGFDTLISNYFAKSFVYRMVNLFVRTSGDGWCISLARPSNFDPQQRTITLHIHGGEAITFDMNTGKLLRYWSPWPYYFAATVTLLAAIPLVILLIKAGRASLWGLAVVLASLNLLGLVVAIALIHVTLWHSLVVFAALIYSQVGLIAIWVGLGDSRAVVRLAIALTVLFLWVYAGTRFSPFGLRVVPLQFAAVACLLQLLRIGGFRWAHGSRCENANGIRLGRWQFSLKGLLIWSVVISVCLGMNRFVPARYVVHPTEWIGALPPILITLLSAWAVLGNKRTWLRLGLVMILAPLLYPLLFWIWRDFRFFDINLSWPRPNYWGVFMLSLVSELQALLLIGMLAIFRQRGYRLVQFSAAESLGCLQAAN